MEFSASQIAQLVGGTVEGNADVKLHTFAKIESAGPGSLTFLANPKYAHHIYNTHAGAVLLRRDFVAEHPIEATLIRVDDPYSALAQLMRMADELTRPRPTGVEQPSYVADGVEVSVDSYIGAFAYVGAGAKLGQRVQIHPQAYVGPGVSIGDDCIIYPGVKIYRGTRIGSRCIIHSGAVIGADGFGFAPMPDGSYSKIPQMGHVEISDDVEIGANTTIDRATMGATVIGQGTKLDNLIQVAHNVEVGSNTVMAAQGGVAGSAKIGSRCMIGGQVGIAGHISVGDGVSIGAQSGIHASVPDGVTMMGYPAIEARKWLRQSGYLNRLTDLFADVRSLQRQLADIIPNDDNNR
jgi:UDP-3-O-[3-hydroxymyristoyl] glucosamine N-acyltransferase